MSSLWLDGGVLRGYYGEGGDIVLPDFIYDVGGYVFRNQTAVRSVVIPDGAIDVGYGTFSGCSGLTKVVLPDSILRIPLPHPAQPGDLLRGLCRNHPAAPEDRL